MRIENSVPRFTVCHHEWCKTVIPRDGTFYLHRTLMFDSFSCISFDFEWFILKVAFITTYNDDDVGTTKLHNVLYNQCKPNSLENFLFGARYHEWDKNFYPKQKPRISLSGMQWTETIYVGQWPIFHGPVILPYILKTLMDKRHNSNTGSMWCKDLPHKKWVSDLHFMVRRFCLISWRLFDGLMLYWRYWFSVIQMS